MKLLLDENLSRRLLKSLEHLYPGSVHVDDVGLHGASDLDIWRFAALHDLTIVSKDGDFRQLSFVHGAPPKVVRLLVGNSSTKEIGTLLGERADTLQAFDADSEAALLILGR